MPPPLIGCFEAFYLLVGGQVDSIELRSGVVDELGDFIDDVGHRAVELGLIHNGQSIPPIHVDHSVDHLARVVRIQPVCCLPDRRGGIGICGRFLAQPVGDV